MVGSLYSAVSFTCFIDDAKILKDKNGEEYGRKGVLHVLRYCLYGTDSWESDSCLAGHYYCSTFHDPSYRAVV
jgi:hypothetical protein